MKTKDNQSIGFVKLFGLFIAIYQLEETSKQCLQ